MASVALDPAYRRLSVREFLEMDFGGAKAELEDGIIFMVAGGSAAHARIAASIIMHLGPRLRGTGCRPYGPDFAVQTGERTIRYPDVTVHCNDPGASENDAKMLLGDPQMVFEVLSPSAASHDHKIKLPEYAVLAGVREIVLVDTADEHIRLVRRTATGWADDRLTPGAGVTLPSLGLTIPHADIFARD